MAESTGQVALTLVPDVINPKRVLEAACSTDLPQTSSRACLNATGQTAAPTVTVLAATFAVALATTVGGASRELRWLSRPRDELGRVDQLDALRHGLAMGQADSEVAEGVNLRRGWGRVGKSQMRQGGDGQVKSNEFHFEGDGSDSGNIYAKAEF